MFNVAYHGPLKLPPSQHETLSEAVAAAVVRVNGVYDDIRVFNVKDDSKDVVRCEIQVIGVVRPFLVASIMGLENQEDLAPGYRVKEN